MKVKELIDLLEPYKEYYVVEGPYDYGATETRTFICKDIGSNKEVSILDSVILYDENGKEHPIANDSVKLEFLIKKLRHQIWSTWNATKQDYEEKFKDIDKILYTEIQNNKKLYMKWLKEINRADEEIT